MFSPLSTQNIFNHKKNGQHSFWRLAFFSSQLTDYPDLPSDQQDHTVCFFLFGKGLSFVAYGRSVTGQNTKHSRLEASALTVVSIKAWIIQLENLQSIISDCI